MDDENNRPSKHVPFMTSHHDALMSGSSFLLNSKKKFYLGCWNVRTMYEKSKTD